MDKWDIERKLVLKALKEPEFKKKLLAKPKETVAEFLKKEGAHSAAFFDKLDIEVVEGKPKKWRIEIPQLLPSEKYANLSEEELLKFFAGGKCQGCDTY